jgi:hypothetical protein
LGNRPRESSRLATVNVVNALQTLCALGPRECRRVVSAVVRDDHNAATIDRVCLIKQGPHARADEQALVVRGHKEHEPRQLAR